MKHLGMSGLLLIIDTFFYRLLYKIDTFSYSFWRVAGYIFFRIYSNLTVSASDVFCRFNGSYYGACTTATHWGVAAVCTGRAVWNYFTNSASHCTNYPINSPNDILRLKLCWTKRHG